VTFTNEQSGEFQFYELQIRFTRASVITTIDLYTPVRQSVPHTIKLENPLTTPITFNAICNVQEVLMPSTLSVPPQSSVSSVAQCSVISPFSIVKSRSQLDIFLEILLLDIAALIITLFGPHWQHCRDINHSYDVR
jgi:hypothetical protein